MQIKHAFILINLLLTNFMVTSGSISGIKNGRVNKKPNIVIIYVDDLGYGDIGVNGAKEVRTPNIDRLANNGVNFTDAHCSSATCTPSRYSLLTGSYAFRVNATVLRGNAPLLINPRKGTLPRMLQKAGYTTGVVGKWHLGLGNGNVNWNEEIKPGPKEIGFDYSFLIPATGDRVPCVFIENQMVRGLDPADPIQVSYGKKIEGYPTGLEHPELLRQASEPGHSKTIVNGIGRIGYMSGGKDVLWNDENFPFILTSKAKSFITENKENPFFLYLSFHDIHVPRLPNEKFIGKSTMGSRGDAIAQMDWCTGEVIKHLEKLGLAENTFVLFSSDNGPILFDGYDDQARELLGNHRPAGAFRGSKYSVYEAGTRVPTIAYWPGTVKPGISSALLTQVDWYSSLAELVGGTISTGDAPDSENHLKAWLGQREDGREFMLEEAGPLGLRMRNWKYIHPKSGIEWSGLSVRMVESGQSKYEQLYNLKNDISESKNIAGNHPDIVKQMQEKLDDILIPK